MPLAMALASGTAVSPEGGQPGCGRNGDGVGTGPVEKSIDAVDWLRRHMRDQGMADCADALDEAFAKCLQAYLDLQDPASHATVRRTTN